MKRSKKSEWGFEEFITNRPNGAEVKPLEIDTDTVILTVSIPPGMDKYAKESFNEWATHLKRVLPENVFLLVKTKDVEISVQRPPIPKRIEINIRDSTLTGSRSVWQELMNKVEEFDQIQDLVYVQVDMNGCTLDFVDDQNIRTVTPEENTPKYGQTSRREKRTRKTGKNRREVRTV